MTYMVIEYEPGDKLELGLNAHAAHGWLVFQIIPSAITAHAYTVVFAKPRSAK